ncbi:MAG: hypothetical protein MK322_04350 [Pseudomonadales bacterium]|nr:hypothetical protein [Pseudomonadales bacterium]
MKILKSNFFLIGMLVGAGPVQAMDSELSSSDIVYKHAYGFLKEPKYSAGFTHFDYVNPDAKKEGRMRNPAMGSWDNFNNMSVPGGQMGPGLSVESPHDNLLSDSLM